ncbi:CYTH domain-containing protein [Colwellia sp. MSW7]|uniref:CYTH domain-containing protein n=1 Tax=Colwellia maritima TaxID=2912588 RepID=A0ABS9WZ30_9GAMM|nr:CYTH domain-containing protein [Colwellia maritima]MCI2283186.1 CYTH domain-containing protein [Colwellia maritima]
MNTEIELKYQLSESNDENSSVVEAITNMLTTQNCVFDMHQYKLINDYYDNDNLDLRKMDFGLRIRTNALKTQEQHFEQTIKTAGKVIDGLHKRPEYNVDIQSNTLSLALFPENIWPENTNVEQLQQSLHVIFSTDFLRQTWLIHQGGNILELALDLGEIYTAQGKSTLPINEIEIELVSGDEQALFFRQSN